MGSKMFCFVFYSKSFRNIETKIAMLYTQEAMLTAKITVVVQTDPADTILGTDITHLIVL